MRSDFKSPKIHRTPLYRARAAFANMKARCNNADGKNPAYKNVELRFSLEEWLVWSIPKYEFFVIEYGEEISPSVSRFKDKGDYELGNIKIEPFIDNINSANDLRVNLKLRDDGTKICSNCRIMKDAKDFNKSRCRVDGLHHQCRDCAKEANRKWRAKFKENGPKREESEN